MATCLINQDGLPQNNNNTRQGCHPFSQPHIGQTRATAFPSFFSCFECWCAKRAPYMEIIGWTIKWTPLCLRPKEKRRQQLLCGISLPFNRDIPQESTGKHLSWVTAGHPSPPTPRRYSFFFSFTFQPNLNKDINFFVPFLWEDVIAPADRHFLPCQYKSRSVLTHSSTDISGEHTRRGDKKKKRNENGGHIKKNHQTMIFVFPRRQHSQRRHHCHLSSTICIFFFALKCRALLRFQWNFRRVY